MVKHKQLARKTLFLAGPAGAAGPALGQCTGESLESIVVGKRETAKTGKTKPGEQVGKDSGLFRSSLDHCTQSITGVGLSY